MATQSFGRTLFPPSLAVGNEAAQDLLILGIHEFHAADFSLRTLEVIRKYTLGVRQSAGFLKYSLNLLYISAGHMLLAVILKKFFRKFGLHSTHIHIEDRLLVLSHIRSDILPEDLRICKYSQNVIHDLIRDTNVPRAPVKGCHLLRLRAAEDHAQMERSDHRVAGCLKEVNIINGLFEEFCSLLLPDAGILDLVWKDHVQELASDCLNDNIIKIRDQLPQGRVRAVGVGQEFICIINTEITHTYTS